MQAIRNSNVKKQCGSCGIGQLLLLLLITGLMYLAVTHSKHSAASHGKKVGKRFEGTETLSQLWNRKGAPKVSSPGKVAHGGGISVSGFNVDAKNACVDLEDEKVGPSRSSFVRDV